MARLMSYKTFWLNSRFWGAMSAITREAIRVRLPALADVMYKFKETEIERSNSCEMPRWGRNQDRSNDQKPSIVLT